MILEVERELLDAVPNITMKYDTDITPDDFGIECVKTALKTAKPSFANHKMFKKMNSVKIMSSPAATMVFY